MTYVVPFDGSDLAEAALAKARVHAIALDEAPSDLRQYILRERPLEVIAVAVIPESRRYAREKGWIDEREDFSSRRIVERLHQQVVDLDPSAEFQFERVDGGASAGTISNRLRETAESVDADLVFVGSENAGRIVTSISSVASGVTADRDYDVCIVRHTLPPAVKERLKSDFFLWE